MTSPINVFGRSHFAWRGANEARKWLHCMDGQDRRDF